MKLSAWTKFEMSCYLKTKARISLKLLAQHNIYNGFEVSYLGENDLRLSWHNLSKGIENGIVKRSLSTRWKWLKVSDSAEIVTYLWVDLV